MAATKKPAKKNPAKPSKAVENALTDARYIYGRAKARFAAFKKFDANRKRKLLPESDLKAYFALSRELSSARGQQVVKIVTSKTETVAERDARDAVFEIVSEIRETIRLSFPDHAVLATAFGAGHRAKTSADARDVSSLAQNSYADEKLGPMAKEAGITPAHIAQAVNLRQKLVRVAGERLTNTGAQKGDTTTTKTLVRRLEKTTTRVIDVAKLVFKGNLKILAEFVRPSRRSPKKKTAAKKTTPTGP